MVTAAIKLKKKKHLLHGRKAMANLDSMLKSKDITGPGPYSQGYGFSVVMHGCEIWTIKKAEHQRIEFLFIYFNFLFIFNMFIYFNWRLITLQYCIGFAIHWHESATGVHEFLNCGVGEDSWESLGLQGDPTSQS